MKRIVVAALILLTAAVANASANNTRIGVNLDALAYYGPFSPRYNLADQVGGNHGTWDTPDGASAAPVNADDYPTADATAYIWKPLRDWPAGNFTVSFAGGGTLKINGHTITSGTPAQIFVDTTKTDGTGFMTLDFTGIDPANPPRDLIIVPRGATLSDAGKWNPAFLKKLAPFTCMRFMDWTHTNNNTAVDWSNRAGPNSCGWTGQYGVPWEYVIDLANNTGKDVWINIPGNANSNYIAQLADLFASRLNGTSHLYIEYSNEIWNGQFQQQGPIVAEAKANPILTASDLWTRVYQHIAWKDKQIGDVFKAAFGSRAAQVRPVFAGQASNFWGIGQGLDFLQATYANVDGVYGVAGAPYLRLLKDVQGETNDDLLADIMSNGLANSTRDVKNDVALAQQYGLPYLCYEGGNEIYGYNGINVASKMSIQTDPRMGQLYREYFQMLAQEGVELFNHYAFVSVPTKWGSWGAWDSLQVASSPKGDALLAAALAGPTPPAEPSSPLAPGGIVQTPSAAPVVKTPVPVVKTPTPPPTVTKVTTPPPFVNKITTTPSTAEGSKTPVTVAKTPTTSESGTKESTPPPTIVKVPMPPAAVSGSGAPPVTTPKNNTPAAASGAPPAAVAYFSDLVTNGSRSTFYRFSVSFTDDVGVLIASLSNRPIYVSGPNGYYATARLKSLSRNTNGKWIVAGFRVSPPHGQWESGDDGVYTIWLHKNRVKDVDGNYAPGAELGTFTVNIAAASAKPGAAQ